MKPVIQEIAEQMAIFDGKPRFMDMSAVINLLNHYSYPSVKDVLEDGGKPVKYKVRIIVETEEIK
jgi:hypothetical protein